MNNYKSVRELSQQQCETNFLTLDHHEILFLNRHTLVIINMR